MVDLAQRRGLTLDTAALSDALGCPVIPMVARKGVGIEARRRPRCTTQVSADPLAASSATMPPPLDAGVDELTLWADRLVERSVGGAAAVGGTGRHLHRASRCRVHASGRRGRPVRPRDGRVVLDALRAGDGPDGSHRGHVRANSATSSGRLLPARCRCTTWSPTASSAASPGTVVFLPQICLLFFLISLLEDTGYLARAAFVMDRVLLPVRPARARLRAAADVARLRAARHHVDAADPRPRAIGWRRSSSRRS